MTFQDYNRRRGPWGSVRHGHLQPSVVQEGEGTVDLDSHKRLSMMAAGCRKTPRRIYVPLSTSDGDSQGSRNRGCRGKLKFTARIPNAIVKV